MFCAGICHEPSARKKCVVCATAAELGTCPTFDEPSNTLGVTTTAPVVGAIVIAVPVYVPAAAPVTEATAPVPAADQFILPAPSDVNT